MTTLFSPHFYFSKEKNPRHPPNWRCHWHRTRSLCYCEQSRSQQTEEEAHQAQFGMCLKVCVWPHDFFLFFFSKNSQGFIHWFFIFCFSTKRCISFATAAHSVSVSNSRSMSYGSSSSLADASDNSCPTSKTLMFLVCYKLTKDWDGAWVLCQWDAGHVVQQILNKQCQRNG